MLYYLLCPSGQNVARCVQKDADTGAGLCRNRRTGVPVRTGEASEDGQLFKVSIRLKLKKMYEIYFSNTYLKKMHFLRFFGDFL